MESLEKRDARLQREREVARKRDAERLAVGLCQDCGGPGRCAGNPRYCEGCWRKRQERTQAWNERVKARRAAEGKAMRPSCTVRCPDCEGSCIRAGISRSGKQNYKCQECGYQHHGVRLQFPLSEGTEVYSVTLQLNLRSLCGLQGYAAKYGIPLNHALRLILRDAAVEPARPMGVGRMLTLESGKALVRVVRPKQERPIPITGPFRFRDVSAETSHKRLSKKEEEGRFRPTVLVVRRIALKLDGLAMAGIVKIMRAFDLNHQEAVRFILERVWRSL